MPLVQSRLIALHPVLATVAQQWYPEVPKEEDGVRTQRH
jgi:hypothetical protein